MKRALLGATLATLGVFCALAWAQDPLPDVAAVQNKASALLARLEEVHVDLVGDDDDSGAVTDDDDSGTK